MAIPLLSLHEYRAHVIWGCRKDDDSFMQKCRYLEGKLK